MGRTRAVISLFCLGAGLSCSDPVDGPPQTSPPPPIGRPGVSGRPAALAVSVSSLDFGPIAIPGGPQRRGLARLTMANVGGEVGEVRYADGVPLCTEDETSVFCLRSLLVDLSRPFGLAPGSAITIEVIARPSEAGFQRQTARFTCDAPGCAASVEFVVEGLETFFECTPDPVLFRSAVGACDQGTLRCRYDGFGQANITNWYSGPNSSDAFVFESPRIIAVGPGRSRTLDIRYCPQRPALDTGELILVVDNFSELTVPVRLQGDSRGPILNAPTAIDFGPVAAGIESRRRLTVRNDGVADLLVNSATVSFGRFRLETDRLPVRVAPGEARMWQVSLTADDDTIVQGEVSLETNDGPAKIALTADVVRLGPCEAEIEPADLDFGYVAPGIRRHRSFTVKNVGSARCLMSEVRTTPAAGLSLLEDGERSVFIEPGSGRLISLLYAPTGPGVLEGSVDLRVSNPSVPDIRIPLSAQPDDTGLLAAPEFVDFGTRTVGCGSDPREVRLHNFGEHPISIEAITSSTTAFTIAALSLPVELPPGSTYLFTVQMTSGAVSTDRSGFVQIDSTWQGSARRHVVDLSSRIRTVGLQRDVFVQAGATGQDVMLVADTTGTFVADQRASIAAALETVVGDAPTLQLGVVAAEENPQSGELCAVQPQGERVVRPSTTPGELQEEIQRRLACVTTENRASLGGGLEAIQRALLPPLRDGINRGFRRADASLAVLLMSARQDASAISVQQVLDVLHHTVGFDRPERANVVAIIGRSPNGCISSSGTAEPAPKYAELASSASGVIRSVCDDTWVQKLRAMQDRLRGRRQRWALRQRPVESTIQVEVNGISLPRFEGWNYEFSRNTLMLIAPPEPGIEVSVSYETRCR